jgi:hypothetical protein
LEKQEPGVTWKERNMNPNPHLTYRLAQQNAAAGERLGRQPAISPKTAPHAWRPRLVAMGAAAGLVATILVVLLR